MATYLTRTNGSAVTAERKLFTISFWVKRCATGVQHALCSAGNGGGSEEFSIRFQASDQLDIFHYTGSFQGRLITNRLFRDVNAWYHIYFLSDTANGTAGDRMQLYINGVRETSFATNSSATQNDLLPWNVDERHQIGSNSWGNSGNGSSTLNGIISHFYNVAGSNIAVTQFGSTDATTGEWKINTSPTIASYGTAGFLVLKDGNTVTDQSPNSNNFTVGGTLTKTEDCPSNVFSTLNALATSSYNSLTQGNNTVKGNTGTNDGETYSTLGTSNSGKYYWEIKATGLNGNGNPKLGFVQSNRTSVMRLQNGGSGYGGAESGSLDIMVRPDGKVLENGSTSSVLYNTFSAGNILSFALDSDNGAFYYAINGTWQNSGNPASGASRTGAIKTWTPTDAKALGGQHICIGTYDTATQADCNFGNGYFGTTAVATNSGNGYAGAEGSSIFNYQPPTGYSALSTKGLNT